MVLGDLTYQKLSGEMHFVKDPQLVDYINRIGQRLISHLPPTGLKFQFFIIDMPEANAFDVPGGYIFISRKLVGFANTEDELAGVMGHELGHAVVRHGASDFSQLLKKILNITQVGDRKDIAEKYNLLIERRRTKQISRTSEEDDQQLQADRVGLFAMIAAGYDPNAFAGFFDRLVETKGKTGNWFTDIFGKAKPEEKRLREMIKISEQIPAQCRDSSQGGASQEFLKWQAAVVSYHEANQKEELHALLWKKELSPKLRSDISHFAFSGDGKYFLAQDDFAVTVVSRDPLEVAFQIPAPEADDATFTSDGQFVVFGTKNLRFEKWSVRERQPAQIRELVVRRDCWEHGFSPDGNYLVCLDYGLNLDVIDTQTGKKVWEKKGFYRLSLFELLAWVVLSDRKTDELERTRLFHIEFSPDSHFVAVSRSSRFRFRFSVDALVEDASQDTLLALDLQALKPVNVGSDLKKMTRRPFLFLDSNRILGMSSIKLEDSGIFSFPEGKRLSKLTIGGDQLKRTANPEYVIMKPLANAKMGLLDLTHNSIVSLNKVDASVWNNLLVYESVNGKVVISEFAYNDEKKLIDSKSTSSIDVPVASLGQPRTAEISDNLQWLALSSKTRGALWDLNSGQRKMFVRGFNGAILAKDGGAIADFPKQLPAKHSLAILNPSVNSAQVLREIPEKGSRQYGQFVLVRRSLKDLNEEKSGDKPEDKPAVDNDDSALNLNREVRFEVHNVIEDRLVWSRDFPKESPAFFCDQFSGRLILYWRLGSEVGKSRLKEDADLAARAKEMGNKDDDYLVEVIDPFAAKTVGTLLLETGNGSFYIESGFSEGDWLVLHDSQNRVLAYSIKEGDLRYRFFGSNAALNPSKSLIAVENYPGELTLYDLGSGDAEGKLNFGKNIAFVRFSLDGKRLFVLSSEQTAYAFEVDGLLTSISAR